MSEHLSKDYGLVLRQPSQDQKDPQHLWPKLVSWNGKELCMQQVECNKYAQTYQMDCKQIG